MPILAARIRTMAIYMKNRTDLRSPSRYARIVPSESIVHISSVDDGRSTSETNVAKVIDANRTLLPENPASRITKQNVNVRSNDGNTGTPARATNCQIKWQYEAKHKRNM